MWKLLSAGALAAAAGFLSTAAFVSSPAAPAMPAARVSPAAPAQPATLMKQIDNDKYLYDTGFYSFDDCQTSGQQIVAIGFSSNFLCSSDGGLYDLYLYSDDGSPG
jgi:hypothetical protein